MLTIAAWMGGTPRRVRPAHEFRLQRHRRLGRPCRQGRQGQRRGRSDAGREDPSTWPACVRATTCMGADPYSIRDRHRADATRSAPSASSALWPDKITIHVDQRKPIALWQDKWRRLARRSTRAAAPSREADPTKYSSIFRVWSARMLPKPPPRSWRRLANSRTSQTRLDTAYRVGGRRWDIKFKGRADVVVFPDDAQLMKALECAQPRCRPRTRLLDLPILKIDARHLPPGDPANARRAGTSDPPGGA